MTETHRCNKAETFIRVVSGLIACYVHRPLPDLNKLHPLWGVSGVVGDHISRSIKFISGLRG